MFSWVDAYVNTCLDMCVDIIAYTHVAKCISQYLSRYLDGCQSQICVQTSRYVLSRHGGRCVGVSIYFDTIGYIESCTYELISRYMGRYIDNYVGRCMAVARVESLIDAQADR